MIHVLYKLYMRIVATKRVWFGRDRHFVIISLDKKNLVELIKDEDFEINILTHGLRDYNVMRIIKNIAEKYDDIDMALLKADYEAKALNK